MDKVDGIECASSACMIDHVLTNHRHPCEGQSIPFRCLGHVFASQNFGFERVQIAKTRPLNKRFISITGSTTVNATGSRWGIHYGRAYTAATNEDI